MGNGSCSAAGDEVAAPEESGWGRALLSLSGQLEELRGRVRQLEAPETIRAQHLELVDEDGTLRLRLGYLGEEDLFGLECLRTDGSLSAFFGQVAGEGSLMFTGGSFDNIVVEFGANELGAHLTVADPSDSVGGRTVDALEQARRDAASLP